MPSIKDFSNASVDVQENLIPTPTPVPLPLKHLLHTPRAYISFEF